MPLRWQFQFGDHVCLLMLTPVFFFRRRVTLDFRFGDEDDSTNECLWCMVCTVYLPIGLDSAVGFRSIATSLAVELAEACTNDSSTDFCRRTLIPKLSVVGSYVTDAWLKDNTIDSCSFFGCSCRFGTVSATTLPSASDRLRRPRTCRKPLITGVGSFLGSHRFLLAIHRTVLRYRTMKDLL